MKRNTTVAFQISDRVQGILVSAENRSRFVLVKVPRISCLCTFQHWGSSEFLTESHGDIFRPLGNFWALRGGLWHINFTVGHKTVTMDTKL